LGGALNADCQILPLDGRTFPAWAAAFATLERRCIYASPDYISVLQRHYGDAAELFLYAEGERLVYFPYFKRALGSIAGPGVAGGQFGARFDISSSWYYGGPYHRGRMDDGLAQRFRLAFDDHAAASGCVCLFVRFDPNAGNERLFDGDATAFERESVYVDLRLGRDNIWRQFNQSNRWGINRAKRDGIGVVIREVDHEESWTRFLAVYGDEMKRKNAPLHLRFDADFFETLRNRMKHNLRLAVAVAGSTICGAHLIIFDERTAYAYLSATAYEFWSTQVNNLMWSEAIWWALEAGKERYDLQGGRPGVFKFKSHFSRTRGQFYVRRKIYDRPAYDALTAAVGASNRKPAGDYFPAYRAP
jgi:hypothetical protein